MNKVSIIFIIFLMLFCVFQSYKIEKNTYWKYVYEEDVKSWKGKYNVLKEENDFLRCKLIEQSGNFEIWKNIAIDKMYELHKQYENLKKQQI